MPFQTVDECREALRELGLRRKSLRAQKDSLRDDTRQTISAARGLVPVTEAAELAGLNRSTVYELYIGPGDETNGTRPIRSD